MHIALLQYNTEKSQIESCKLRPLVICAKIVLVGLQAVSPFIFTADRKHFLHHIEGELGV